MAKFIVRAYSVTQHYVEVEAETAIEAQEIGFDKIIDGICEQLEPVWQSEIDVERYFD